MRDDLGVFVGTIAGNLFQVSSKPLMQVTAILLREGAIGRVPNQQVFEPVAAAIGGGRVLEDKSGLEQVVEGFGGVDLPVERGDLFSGKALTHDAGGLDDLLLSIRKGVESCRQQSLDGLRNTNLRCQCLSSPALPDVQQLTLVDQHAKELLAEERIPFGPRQQLRMPRRPN